MNKPCRYCGKSYPEKDFGVAATLPNKVYRRRKCKNCYRDTKKLLLKKYRQWLDEYKQKGNCKHCGIADPRVLDFHHEGHEGKDFNIGDFKRRYGFKKLLEEIDKCVLLCSNCHRILHFEQSASKKAND